MTRLLNLMPHALRVHDENSFVFYELAPHRNADGTPCVARLNTLQTLMGELTLAINTPRISVYTPQRVVRVDGLPPLDVDEQADVTIVVSGMVGEYIAAHPEVWRGAVYSPDSSPAGAGRNADGQIVSTRGLVQHKA